MIMRGHCVPACGRRIRSSSGSICDALLSPQPGEMTFAMNKGRLAEGYVVSEAEVRRAVRFAFETLKLVVEPGGAAGLAAVLSGKIATQRQEHRHHPVRRQCRSGAVRRNPDGSLGGRFRRLFFHQGNFSSLACGAANDDNPLLWLGCRLWRNSLLQVPARVQRTQVFQALRPWHLLRHGGSWQALNLEFCALGFGGRDNVHFRRAAHH